MSETLETELKLELEPSDQERRLIVPGVPARVEGRAKSLISTYYDTPDQQLRKAGYSLRVRATEGRHIQTVKGQGDGGAGLFLRPEWEQDIPRARPLLTAEGPLALAVGANALGEIKRAFVTEVERKTHKIQFEGATILLADDCGEIRAGRHAEPIREVELELEQGDPRALFALARRIGDEMPVRLGVQSKSERGYHLLNRRERKAFKAEPIALAPDDRTDVAFEKIAHSCIRQFRLNETLLLATGAPEPLHQARVGLRRLRSAFSVFDKLFVGDERADLLRAELRWLAHMLGHVRDFDVLLPHLDGADRDSVAAAREASLAQVMGEVDSARTRLLMLDLTEWLAFGDWRVAPADPELPARPIARTAREALKARRKTIKRDGRKLLDLSDEDRHELRKQAKKLRYAAEFFAALYPDEPARSLHRHFVDRLQKMQEHLGELNDLATFPVLLARAGIQPDHPGALGDRDDLLDKAHQDYEALMALDRFWKA